MLQFYDSYLLYNSVYFALHIQVLKSKQSGYKQELKFWSNFSFVDKNKNILAQHISKGTYLKMIHDYSHNRQWSTQETTLYLFIYCKFIWAGTINAH